MLVQRGSSSCAAMWLCAVLKQSGSWLNLLHTHLCQTVLEELEMNNKTSIYYALYPYRSSTPQEILIAIRCELMAHIDNICHVKPIFEQQVVSNELSPSVTEIFDKLSQTGQQLLNIIINYSSAETVYTQETISEFRKQVLPEIEALHNFFNQIRSIEPEIEAELPWIKGLNDQTEVEINHIQAVIDVLTMPDFELPVHLATWLSIRDDVTEKATTGNSEAIPLLLQALDNPEPLIRTEVVDLLRHINSPEIVEPLVNLLQDPVKQVSLSAARLLGALGDRRAVEPLADALDFLGIAASSALLALGDLRGKDYLIDQLKSDELGHRNQALAALINHEKQRWEKAYNTESNDLNGLAAEFELRKDVIAALEAYIQHYGQFSWDAHNELRHLYGEISEKKEMGSL